MSYSVDRTLKVADLIKTELAQLLLYRAGDPRFHHVTITAVRVSRDLGHAKVFFPTLTPSPESSESLDSSEELMLVLNKASSYFRTLLAKNSAMRTVPRLHFVYDISVSHGQHLANLIDEAIAKDSSTAQPINKDIDNDSK